MDTELKTQVEALYRSLGTSFAEAVRVFAQQSLREGGMPFRPSLKTWDEMTEQEIASKLERSEQDIEAGRVCTQEALDSRMRARTSRGRDQAV
jgi:addiction module RelB/DinJ family antitoxin